MLEFDSYNIGSPQNLVIFMHGYNGTVATHQYALDWLHSKLTNAVLIIPHAPQISDKNPERRQWFGMQKYDMNNLRSLPSTTVAEIMDIYNQTSAEIDACALNVNNFINHIQQQYNLDDDHTFLCGFSQGAMLTIYTALSRNADLGGVFVLSGLVAGADLLQTKITAHPKFYLFHGDNDLKVQYKTLSTTIDWLQRNHISVDIRTYTGLAHKMNEDEMQQIANIINQKGN